MNHYQILEKILFEKKVSKRELARLLGYSEQNASNILNKEVYSDKMIDKICTALNIDSLPFGESISEKQSILSSIESIFDENQQLKEKLTAVEKRNNLLKMQLAILILNCSPIGEVENLDYPNLDLIDWDKVDIGVQLLRCRVHDGLLRTIESFEDMPKIELNNL